MKKYTVRIWNWKTGEILLCMEMTRDYFTIEDYKNVIREMFFLSCMFGNKAEFLIADIYRNMTLARLGTSMHKGNDVIRLNSRQDGSTVKANLYINGQHVRTMAIAE